MILKENNMETNLSTFEYQKLLNTAMDIGHFLLSAGAETYRVEESIQRILYAYGVKHVDVFAITNNITVTMTMADDTCYTRLRRVYSRTTNYQMVEDLNNLSRYVCQERPPVEEIQNRFQALQQKKSYPEWIVVTLGFGGIALWFTLFFGGSWLDGAVAFAAGCLTRVVFRIMTYLHASSFFVNLICSLMVTTIAMKTVQYGLADNSDFIIIGTLMTLVPGVAITNAMRDVIAGDLLAGTMKGVEALLIALALAAGTAVALIAMGGVLDGTVTAMYLCIFCLRGLCGVF